MNVNMFVGASQSQASSAQSKSRQDQQSYENMLQALQQFINEDQLNSTAYTNAKGFYSAVLIPLTKAGILLSEAVGEACQKFVQDYQSTVDSGDLKSDELEEKIHQLDMRMSQLDSIRATIQSKDLADNFKLRQLNQNAQARSLLEDSKAVLQDKLDKLMNFHDTSPAIFSNISALEAVVNQGAAQAGSSFTGSGFSIPRDLGWTSSVADKWQTRADNIKKKEKEFHEKKIKELEKHNVYAMPYEDPETKEIKIMWFIDKDGVRVFDKELQDYVERYGKNLEGIYEVVSWEKIYELDLAARRKGDGKNYLNSNQLENWKTYSLVGAHFESAYWMANKTGLLDLAMAAGLVYADKKIKASAAQNNSFVNKLDDIDVDIPLDRQIDDSILIEPYKDLRKNKDISGQAHHLNQDAAFRERIPSKEGVTLKLEGNIFQDIGSPHYKAHEVFEEFWEPYRKADITPTIDDYNNTLHKSLMAAGLTEAQANYAVDQATKQQLDYGIIDTVPNVPGKINLPKQKK